MLCISKRYLFSTEEDLNSIMDCDISSESLGELQSLSFGLPEQKQIEIQKKTFTKWINLFLSEEYEIKDLFRDLRNGIKLQHLCETLFNEKVDKYIGVSENYDKSRIIITVLIFLQFKINLIDIPSEAIIEGRPDSILKLIWAIILYKIRGVRVDDHISFKFENLLLHWCQSRIKNNYPTVIIQDFSASWRNGLGFNALIHSYRPDLVNFPRLFLNSAVCNLKMAFGIAFFYFDIPKLLDPEDVDTNRPDKKSIILYLTYYYDLFSKVDYDSKDAKLLEKNHTLESRGINQTCSDSHFKEGHSSNENALNYMNYSNSNAPLRQGTSSGDIPPENHETSGLEKSKCLLDSSANCTVDDVEADSGVLPQVAQDRPLKNIVLEEVIIVRGVSEILGVHVCKGNDKDGAHQDTDSYFIEKIVNNSVAHRDGRLKVGMQLLEVNGQSLLGVSNFEAMKIFQSCDREIIFLVSREVENPDKAVESLPETSNGQKCNIPVRSSCCATDNKKTIEQTREELELALLLEEIVFREEEKKKEREKIEMETQVLLQLEKERVVAEQEELLQLQLEQADLLDEEKQEFAVIEEEVRTRLELFQCECCFTEDVSGEDIITCIEGHLFCKDCVKKAVEVAFGDSKIHFNCLAECNSHFKVETLENILPKNLHDKILQKIQEEEVRKANIEGFVCCPYCEYGEILTEKEVVFNCKLCLKLSCRFCQEKDHSPLTCAEVKDKEQTSARTKIEAKMTEALLRECYKCKKKFIKQTGCNKMQCVCGALMCYLCRQPVRDYSHFVDNNGIQQASTSQQPQKCPLWSNNTDLHVNAVIEAANTGTRDAENENPALKFEPNAFLQGLL